MVIIKTWDIYVHALQFIIIPDYKATILAGDGAGSKVERRTDLMVDLLPRSVAVAVYQLTLPLARFVSHIHIHFICVNVSALMKIQGEPEAGEENLILNDTNK